MILARNKVRWTVIIINTVVTYHISSSMSYFVDQHVINYTVRVVRPSLRESSRAEWRTTNHFLSVNKKPNYI